MSAIRSPDPPRAGGAIRNYALVTGAYWGFTLTDGALRMLVLLLSCGCAAVLEVRLRKRYHRLRIAFESCVGPGGGGNVLLEREVNAKMVPGRF